MILPQKELKDFSYFTTDFKNGVDTVTLHYNKKLLWVMPYTSQRIFTFKCDIQVKKGEKFAVSTDGHNRFVSQLDAIVSGTWVKVSKENYEQIKHKHPELLL